MKRTIASLLTTAVIGIAATTDMSALIERPKPPRGTECFPDFSPSKPQSRVCICRLVFVITFSLADAEIMNMCVADYTIPVDFLPSECMGPKENNLMCDQDGYTPEGEAIDPTSYWVGNVPRFGIYPGRGRW